MPGGNLRKPERETGTAVDSHIPKRCRGQNPMRVVRDREITDGDFGKAVQEVEPQERSTR